jgi:hypothetical protein
METLWLDATYRGQARAGVCGEGQGVGAAGEESEMTKKETGGPAFPTPRIEVNNEGVITGFSVMDDGMTLRDYFAAKAMQGLIERETTRAFNFETYKDDPWRVALWAYDVADQMLRVRSER